MMIQQIRREVDRCLRRPMTDGEWQLLENQGHIKRYPSEIGPAGLAEVVNQWRTAVGPPDSVPIRHRSGISERRSNAIEKMIAAEAARDEEVHLFRNSVLRGKLLEPGEIEKWIQRQSKIDGRTTKYLRVPMPDDVTLTIDDRGIIPSPPIVLSEDWPAVGGEIDLLDYWIEGNDWVHRIPVAHGGVLQKLFFLSEKLARRYVWQAAQATAFILCGLPPELSPLKIEVNIAALDVLSRVTVTIDPAVSPRELANAYKDVRKRVMTSRPRTLHEKKQTLAVFMSSRPDGETQRESMAVWNKRYRKWHYKDIRNFGRDVAAARRQLLSPGHLNFSSLSKILPAGPKEDEQ